MDRVLTAATLVALLGLASCAPDSQYRYSAFVPAARPLPWDGRIAKGGSLRIEGTATNTNVIENLTPKLHDTAVLVPSLTLEGSVMLAVTSKVEFGVRGAYASYDSAQESAVGTMPVPNAPASVAYGPEVRFALPVADKGRFQLGFALQAMSTSVAYATWQASSCTISSTCVLARDLTQQRYQLLRTDSETHWTTTIAVFPSYASGEHGEYGHVFGGVTATSGFQNDGFTDQLVSGSTVSTFWPLWVLSAGYGYQVDILRFSASIFRPMTSAGSPVDYSLGGYLSVGIAPRLWEGKD